MRVYPLRLQVSKSQKAKEKSASMVLRRRPPRSAPQVIPERCLLPGPFNRVFVLTTRFPPDDRSLGYERGAAVSQAWSQATADAALEVAGHVVARLPELSGANSEDSDRAAKLKEFCRRWAQRAFRRPLDAQETAFFVEQPFAVKTDPQAAVERSLLLTLLSPRFLYCELPAGKLPAENDDSYRIAARLALILWDSLPDEKLTREAAAGNLAKPDEVRRQAERMATDLRARAKLRDVFPALAQRRTLCRVKQGPEGFSGIRRADDRGPAHVARSVSRRRNLERGVGFPAVAAFGRPVPQRSAEQAVWRLAARGRPVPESVALWEPAAPGC